MLLLSIQTMQSVCALPVFILGTLALIIAINQTMVYLETKEIKYTLPSNISASTTTTTSKRILFPLPVGGFDPTEVAVPWKILTQRGHQVTFATPQGQVSTGADQHVLQGLLGGLIQVFPQPYQDYLDMIQSEEYLHPISFHDLIHAENENIRINQFDGVFIGGGHHPVMSTLLNAHVLHEAVRHYWTLNKPVAAVCHGVLVLSRAGIFNTYTLNTTAVPRYLEAQGYLLTKYLAGMGDYQLSTTLQRYTQDEIEDAIYKGITQTPFDAPQQQHDDASNTSQSTPTSHFISGPYDLLAPLMPGSLHDHTHAFIVEDNHYLSGRFWGDAYLLALRFAAKVEAM